MSDWHDARVRYFDSCDSVVEHFKTTEKKPVSPTIDVNVRPTIILERNAIAIVVKTL